MEERQVTTEEGGMLADRLSIPLFAELSAKNSSEVPRIIGSLISGEFFHMVLITTVSSNPS